MSASNRGSLIGLGLGAFLGIREVTDTFLSVNMAMASGRLHPGLALAILIWVFCFVCALYAVFGGLIGIFCGWVAYRVRLARWRRTMAERAMYPDGMALLMADNDDDTVGGWIIGIIIAVLIIAGMSDHHDRPPTQAEIIDGDAYSEWRSDTESNLQR